MKKTYISPMIKIIPIEKCGDVLTTSGIKTGQNNRASGKKEK